MTGAELRAWRKAQKYTQDTFAKELGVVRQTVVAWEASDAIPRLVVLAVAGLERPAFAGVRMSAPEQRRFRVRAKAEEAASV